MSRKILLVCITSSLAMTACALAVQVERSARTQTPSPIPHPAKVEAFNFSAPALTQTSNPTPTSTKPGTYAASVLVAEWDSKSREHMLYPLDTNNGQALTDYDPIPLGEHFYHSFSTDRSTMAIAMFGSSEHPYGSSLMLIDLATWKEQVFDLQMDSYISNLAFSPDGQRLAITYGSQESKVAVFDFDQEAITTRGSLDLLASRLKFTSDGARLMIYGTVVKNRFTANEMTSGPPKAVLLDATDLSLLWLVELEGVRDGIYPKDVTAGEKIDLHQPGAAVYFYPGLAFAPNHNALHVVHPAEDKLTKVDFAAQKVETVEIRPLLSWFERLMVITAGVAHAKVAEGTVKQAVVSPDGQLLYVIGQNNSLDQDGNGGWLSISTPLGLQVIRTADGTRLAHLDTEAVELSISPDGRFLYLRGWGEKMPWTEVLNTHDMKVITRIEGMWLKPTFRMNGEPLLLSSVMTSETQRQHRIVLVDPQKLTILAEWTRPQYLTSLSLP